MTLGWLSREKKNDLTPYIHCLVKSAYLRAFRREDLLTGGALRCCLMQNKNCEMWEWNINENNVN